LLPKVKRPIVVIWLIILFSWSGVIWIGKSGNVEKERDHLLLFLLLLPALTFLLSFVVFLVRILLRKGQDERIVFKSSFWWTLLFVSVILTGWFLNTRKMLDLVYIGILLGIIVCGGMFLKLGLRRGY